MINGNSLKKGLRNSAGIGGFCIFVGIVSSEAEHSHVVNKLHLLVEYS